MVAILGVLTATALVSLRSMTTTTSGAGPAANAAASASLANGTSSAGAPNIGGVPPDVACKATADAARSASNVYFANSGGKYPVKWSDITTRTPPIYTLATNVSISATNARALDAPGWKLIMSGGGATPPTFTCG